ncbi:MAG: cbb3-type cytochrome oxidase assembly protein CcoS [Pseudobacteriovorax sp.]|nr:cbb3-type cytochrome oxidase assembly protein CcoS [Pseudobacteriovorax sp.]
MIVIFMLIGISFILGAGALVSFIWAAKSGQFDDLERPAEEILFDDFFGRS